MTLIWSYETGYQEMLSKLVRTNKVKKKRKKLWKKKQSKGRWDEQNQELSKRNE